MDNPRSFFGGFLRPVRTRISGFVGKRSVVKFTTYKHLLTAAFSNSGLLAMPNDISLLGFSILMRLNTNEYRYC
jgi:hypothetical protein